MQNTRYQPTVVFVGGGTGGHVYPGIAVAHRLLMLHTHYRIVWIGSRHGMEAEIVSREGFRFIGISSGKMRRYVSLKNIVDLFKIFAGFVQAYRILKRIKPSLIFSKGGYVSVPPVVAGRMLRIRIISHESDLDPGLATKVNSRFSDRILIPFEESRRFYAHVDDKKLIASGNPVRQDLGAANAEEGMRILGVTGSKPLLVVLGGSQGAATVNTLVQETLSTLVAEWHVVHQMGAQGYERSSVHGYFTFDYLRSEYPHVLAAADLVVCRAGASTLWEVAFLGKPMLLIPIGLDASRGDQIRNARFFEQKGAARVLWPNGSPHELSSRFSSMIEDLRINREIGITVGKKARALCKTDAAEIISSIIETNLQE